MDAPPDSSEPSQAAAILLVDDDDDLRDVFADVAAGLGLGDCLTAGSLADVERQRPTVLTCSLAILDLNLGANAPSGIDVYHWLEHAHFPGKVVFLTGYGPHDPLVEEASRLASVPTLSKPISLAELRDLAVAARGAGTRATP